MTFVYEFDGKGYRNRSFGESLSELEDLGFFDDDFIENKDHGDTGGNYCYYGGEEIRRSELIY